MWKRRSLLLAALLALAVPCAALAREPSDAEEDRLGREAAVEIEREFPVADKPDQLARVEAILKVIGPVSERPKVTYRAKILETEQANAFALPGGYVYVTTGLLKLVGSDDELAGVLAHEVAHNAHRHATQQIEKWRKMDLTLLPAVLAAVLVGKVNWAHAALFTLMVKVDVVNRYGQKAEMEADRSAVEYLIRSKRYNPVGVLQFLRTMEREERRRPPVGELGALRTHPETPKRIEAVRNQLVARGIPIERVPGTNTPAATARSVIVNGKQIAEVVIRGQPVFQPAVEYEGKRPMERAEDAARLVTQVFREFAEDRYVQVRARGNVQVVLYRETPLLFVTPEDASFHNTTAEALAQRAAGVLKRVIWTDFVQHS